MSHSITILTRSAVLDPVERDWLDYAGFVFNILATAAGLFGLFLAIKAYKVGIRAYEVSADSYSVAQDQGRRTLELDFLKELGLSLDRAIGDGSFAETFKPVIEGLSRLIIFAEPELPTWNFLAFGTHSRSEIEEYVINHTVLGSDLEHSRAQPSYSVDDLVAVLAGLMHNEIFDAMSKRIEWPS
ncbi:hypothetical protein [Micromonospora sp. CA-246542]|uniref:hypothetical protein n=1 Tax=Micromonospora sp. CA-246542 TaxID=3239959 RepID=UPI003D8DDF74